MGIGASRLEQRLGPWTPGLYPGSGRGVVQVKGVRRKGCPGLLGSVQGLEAGMEARTPGFCLCSGGGGESRV